MSNSKDPNKPSNKTVSTLVAAFKEKHERDPDWGELWVIKGNRRHGIHYKREMRKKGLPLILDEWTDTEWDRMSPLEREKSRAAKLNYERKLKRQKDRDAEDKARAHEAATGCKSKKKGVKKKKLMPRVLYLVDQNWTNQAIAEELDISVATVSKWLNSVGISRRKNTKAGEGVHKVSKKGGSYQEELDTAFDKGDISPEEQAILDRKDLDKKTASHQKRVAREDQINAMPEVFRADPDKGERSPAAVYSGFISSMLANKMKEAMVNMPAPKDYRELKIADDIISKHLGIGKDGSGDGGGSGKLTIDLNVLNLKDRPRGEVVTAEIVKSNKQDIEDMTEVARELEANPVETVDEFELAEKSGNVNDL